jgi:hypothetical protein
MEPRGPRPAVAMSPRRAPRRIPRGLWAALLFPAGVLAVHQLRYLLAYGSRAGSELSAHGDHYVAAATVVAAILVIIALGVGLGRLLAASRGSGHPQLARVPVWLLWVGLTLVLFAGFCALEALEVVFEPEHEAGLVGMFGDGGLWAVPAAALVAGLMALLVHGGRALLVLATRQRTGLRAAVTPARHPGPTRTVQPHRPMADCAAGRAPPAPQLV